MQTLECIQKEKLEATSAELMRAWAARTEAVQVAINLLTRSRKHAMLQKAFSAIRCRVFITADHALRLATRDCSSSVVFQTYFGTLQ